MWQIKRLLAEETREPSGISCWSERMKSSGKLLLKDTTRKVQLFLELNYIRHDRSQ